MNHKNGEAQKDLENTSYFDGKGKPRHKCAYEGIYSDNAFLFKKNNESKKVSRVTEVNEDNESGRAKTPKPEGKGHVVQTQELKFAIDAVCTGHGKKNESDDDYATA